jgi:Tetracyclin repressor-like, C-terminal domain
MATTKKTPTKKAATDENKIITLFMEEVLEDNRSGNVYAFCKKHSIEESSFYSFFSSLKLIENKVWVKFFQNAIETIEKDNSYETYSAKNKLLALYFTLFEILTINRSYVMLILERVEDDLKNAKQFKDLRNSMKEYVAESIIDNDFTEIELNNRINKVTKPIFSEGAWIQFLFILRFWKNDTSKDFEKTDIVIEKSVNTVVDLLNTKPLETLIDLGKFLWKEAKMN